MRRAPLAINLLLLYATVYEYDDIFGFRRIASLFRTRKNFRFSDPFNIRSNQADTCKLCIRRLVFFLFILQINNLELLPLRPPLLTDWYSYHHFYSFIYLACRFYECIFMNYVILLIICFTFNYFTVSL